jgi:hypothetical protein
MTDALDRAVDARVDAYRPDKVPPFEVVQARKRARERRRGAAAAATAALAVAGIAFVPSALGSRDDGRNAPPSVANRDDGTAVFGYHVKATDARAFRDAGLQAQAALDRCFAMPGLSEGLVLFSFPAQYTGRVTGSDEAEAFEACVDAVPGTDATLTPVDEEARDRPGLAWTGAEVCSVGSEEPCRQLDADQAAALDRVLDRAVPAPDGTAYCEALSPIYRVLFQHSSAKTVPIDVPLRCGPVLKGTEPYLLDQAGRDEVQRAFVDAPASPSGDALTAEQQRFVNECVGREKAPACTAVRADV